MDFDLAVKVIGWAMALTPLTVFVVVSFYMMSGAAEDDDSIKGLLMLGVGIFALGVILLAASYFTNFSTSWFFPG